MTGMVGDLVEQHGVGTSPQMRRRSAVEVHARGEDRQRGQSIRCIVPGVPAWMQILFLLSLLALAVLSWPVAELMVRAHLAAGTARRIRRFGIGYRAAPGGALASLCSAVLAAWSAFPLLIASLSRAAAVDARHAAGARSVRWIVARADAPHGLSRLRGRRSEAPLISLSRRLALALWSAAR